MEKEKKELKKQREREKKEQLRKEGKLLTAKQRADKARAEQMLASMRAQGIDVSSIFSWTHFRFNCVAYVCAGVMFNWKP